MEVTLELYGLPSQKTTTILLRIENDIAIVKGYGCPEEKYRLSDGRRLDENGVPTAWDFWRLSEKDRRRTKAQGVKNDTV